MPRKRKRLKRGRGVELSGVKNPCQLGADVMSIKSTDISNSTSRKNLGTIATDIVDGHQHVVSVSVYNGSLELNVRYATSDGIEEEHRHDVYLDDQGNILLSVEDGHTHVISEDAINNILSQAMVTRSQAETLLKSIKVIDSEQSNKTDNINNDEGNDNMSQPTIEDVMKEIEGLKKENALLKANDVIKSFTEDEKAHYDSLDEKAKADFLAKSEDERKAVLEKAIENAKENPLLAKALKDIADLKAENAEMKAAAKDKEISEKAAKLGVKKFYIKTVMEAAEAGDEEAVQELKDLESKKSALDKKAGIRMSKGSGDNKTEITINTPTEAEAKIKEMVEEKMAKMEENGQEINYGKALQMVIKTKEGKELYDKSLEQGE